MTSEVEDRVRRTVLPALRRDYAEIVGNFDQANAVCFQA
jgi:hypothetical protein